MLASTKIDTPGGVGKDFTAQDRELAWLLLTELRTRITTQELPLRDGVEETALQSVYDFFKLARSMASTLKQPALLGNCRRSPQQGHPPLLAPSMAEGGRADEQRR